MGSYVWVFIVFISTNKYIVIDVAIVYFIVFI